LVTCSDPAKEILFVRYVGCRHGRSGPYKMSDWVSVALR
jgi:hypothetical protein